MALFKRTTTGPLGVETEEFDVDNIKLVGVALTVGIAKGLYEWVSSRFQRSPRS